MCLPPTWQPVYAEGLKTVLALPLRDIPVLWDRPSQTLLRALQPLQEPQEPQQRQAHDVWLQMHRLRMPGPQREFMRRALWQKLKVGARTKNVFHRPNCVSSGTLETMRHALSTYQFFPLAADIVLKAFGPVWGDTGLLWDMQILLVKEPLFSLITTQRLALWAAA